MENEAALPDAYDEEAEPDDSGGDEEDDDQESVELPEHAGSLGASNPPRIYLDSCFYIEYLKGDNPEHDILQTIIDAWKAGEVEVITSSLTIVEVLWLRCEEGALRVAFPKEREDEVRDLFHMYGPRRFVLVELDRTIAEAARRIVWDANIKPKDAVHVASAQAADAGTVFTLDKGMIAKSARDGGAGDGLTVAWPHWIQQIKMPLEIDPIVPPVSHGEEDVPVEALASEDPTREDHENAHLHMTDEASSGNGVSQPSPTSVPDDATPGRQSDEDEHATTQESEAPTAAK